MNAWSLRWLFDRAEIENAAQPLPALGPFARMMSNLHAVYHACIHRAVHIQNPYSVGDAAFYGGDRLIWLYDLHLLLPKLSNEDWAGLLALCKTQATSALCLNALTEAKRLLGTPVPEVYIKELAATVRPSQQTRYLMHGTRFQRFMADLRAIPKLDAKLAFLRAVLFPSRAYMHAKYPERAQNSVFLLYMLRLGGALRRNK